MLFQGKCPQYRTVSPLSWHALHRTELAHCRSAGNVSPAHGNVYGNLSQISPPGPRRPAARKHRAGWLAVYISPGWRACRTHPSYDFLLGEGAFVVGFG